MTDLYATKPTPFEAGMYAYGRRERAILAFRQRTHLGFVEAYRAFQATAPPRRVDWERMDPEPPVGKP